MSVLSFFIASIEMFLDFAIGERPFPWATASLTTQNSSYNVELGVLRYSYHLEDSGHHKCSYSQCSQHQSVANNSSLLSFYDSCESKSPEIAQICQNCHDAGIQAYSILASTCLIQLLLVWLTRARAWGGSDSRCHKFWFLVLSTAVMFGTVTTYFTWRYTCTDELNSSAAATFAISNDAGETWDCDMEVHWASTTPIWSGVLTCCVSIISMLTPVPELYSQCWFDPKPSKCCPTLAAQSQKIYRRRIRKRS
jgi:hypothetical protein